MPSVLPNEIESHYMERCVPMLIGEGKDKDQAVAQCMNMFKENFQEKSESKSERKAAQMYLDINHLFPI